MFWKAFKKTATKTEAAQPQIEGEALPLAFLTKLIPIGSLPTAQLQKIKARIYSYAPGDIVFNRGEAAEYLLYLLSGSVYLEAPNGNGYSVEADTFKACYPLSGHDEHLFVAIAKTPCKIAYLPLSLLQRGGKATNAHNPLLNARDIPPALADSGFFHDFCSTFQQEELHVPSLPDVALRLRRALQRDIDIADAAKIVNLDPAIASRLIQVANSPLYRPASPITETQTAISRLGLKSTQNVVTSFSLHNLFRSRNKLLNTKVQQIWRQSIQIASISSTLAHLTGRINAEEAMLAGLIQNIGALPVITYAETLSLSTYTEQELDLSIAALQGPIGVFILKKWHFPEAMQRIPSHCLNWYHDDGPDLQLADIVLLARFHGLLGGAQGQKLPPLGTLPAFGKLGESALTPDMSLQLLQDAKQQIAETLSFFRS